MKPISLFSLILFALPAVGQETSSPPVVDLDEIVVTGKADDLIGIVPSASQGQASAEDIARRPYLRRSEILETVPGLITTQHAGGGKATQYFLRGFNLDHGTDFATSIDGMPMNLKTHAHGQGYTDLNPLIPELIQRVDYVKGTYTAANGDLSTAGSADFLLFDVLPHDIVSAEFGRYGWYRGLMAGSLDLAAPPATEGNAAAKNPTPAAMADPETLTYALEYNAYEGPFDLSENFERWNGLLRYYRGDVDNHFAATLMGYRGTWTSSDQIPQRAVDRGIIARLGYLDPTNGGESQRYSLNLEWATREGDVVTRANVYGIYYDLDLFSNFTYFLDYPEQGDQFEQAEQRWIFGGNIARTWERQSFAGKEADFTLGLQTRHDLIEGIGLWRTQQQDRFKNIRQDDVYEASVGVYADSVVHWNDWFRTQVGLRGDVFYFDTASNLAANSGDDFDAIVSPKVSAIFGPWHETELYLNFGTGFHSNDARGVSTIIDPNTGEGIPTVDPLVRTMGAELGIRTQVIPKLTSTLTFFWLESDSELVYVGDAGLNEAGPGSRRFGAEWSNYWRPTDWFSMDAEVALTHGRFVDAGNDDHIPASVPMMFSGGVNFGAQGDADGFFANIRARAFGRRPLTEDNSVKGKSSFLVNAGIGYRKNHWEAAVECLNLFDRNDNDIEYFYASRLPGEAAAGVEDIHFHPTEPRSFRVRLTYKF
ncbi:MAG: TonB-dependent receptor plug domain-containing protein [Verrucomicrobiales bacterium]|nr:TonB-dependent receptor plug domain-containing protein [Verrucomicrobiales bacterium]MCP5559692.1 TonB-dependent receptor plug domain-containing protein [Verrucomicrobiaceae bacterium]